MMAVILSLALLAAPPTLPDTTLALCEEFDFEPAIIYGVMYVETRCQNINSQCGEYIGPMQVSKTYFPNALVDPIRAGFEALSAWRDAGATTYPELLSAYNQGWSGLSSPDSSYAKAVLEAAEQYTDALLLLEGEVKPMENIKALEIIDKLIAEQQRKQALSWATHFDERMLASERYNALLIARKLLQQEVTS